MTTQNYRAVKIGVVLAASAFFIQGALAHTRLDNPVVQESTSAHGTYDTAVVIPHGCDGNPVIGNVFVMPDQTDSIVQTSTDGFETFETSGQTAADFVAAGGFIRLIKSNDVFAKSGLISDTVGNPVGFWAADGELPASNWVGKLPLRISSVDIQDESCANSVNLVPAIANVCQLSSVEGFGDGVVDLWTAPDAGSSFDAPDWSYPASFTVERDLENSPLPESCGNGFDVRIFPSATQLDRDMPVEMNGQRIWPQP